MALLFSLLRRCLPKLSSFSQTLSWRVCVAPLASAAALTSGSPAVALPGQLDNTFATICALAVCSGGRLFTTVGSEGYAAINAMALQPDGKIVVAGSCDHRITGLLQDGLVHQRICIERYRAPAVATDSWRDTTFGTNGLTISAPFRNNNVTVASIAVNSDGTILVAGTCTRTALPDQMCVVRLLANGQLDGSFGTATAAASVVFPVAARLTKMLLLPNGHIALVGRCGSAAPYSLCGAFLHPNGALDTDYGVNGLAINTAFDFYPTGAVLRADGSIAVVGTSLASAVRQVFFSSLQANGALGNSNSQPFPAGVTASIDSASAGVVETASGKLVVAGTCRNNSVDAVRDIFCLRRLNEFGFIDTTFGISGYAYASPSTGTGIGTAVPQAIAIQPDGKIVLVGTCRNAANDFCAVRFHSDGELDASFDSDGLIGDLTNAPAANAYALALQPDGKILLGGGCTDNGAGKFCTVRLQGGPYGYKQCTMDIDGDGQVLGTTDAIIHARVTAGLSGSAVLNGLTFAPSAQRTTWPAIRDFLGYHCGMRVSP